MRTRFLIHYEDRCAGCKLCELVCATYRFGVNNPEKAAIHVRESGDRFLEFSIIVCQHCEDPPCVRICPTRLLYKASDGRVLIGKGECLRCGLCLEACPRGAVFFHPDINGPIICNLCDGKTRCVDFCPRGALIVERRAS